MGPWSELGRRAAPVRAPGQELTQLRTRRSRTFARADGTRVTRVYQQSMNYQAGSHWQRIDNRLERSGSAWANAANRFSLRIPQRLANAPLRIEHEDRWLSFRLQGARDVAARVDGDRASFRDVLPGVTARWSAENDAVKEELVLAHVRVPRSYRFGVAGSAGLRVRPLADGGLEFVDGAGRSAFVVPAAFAYDARGFEAPKGTVSLSAKPGGSGWIVELRIAGGWLDRAAFPVTVDPTIEVPSEPGDCKLDGELSSTSFCSLNRLEVGWSSNGSFPHDHRSILKFDVDAALPPGAQVTSAELHAFLGFRESGAEGKSVRVHRVTSPWTDDATWLSSAAGVAWANPGGDFASQIEAQVTAGEDGEWHEWQITDLVDGWMSRTIPNQGLVLKDDGTHVDGSLVYSSTESDEWAWPHVEIAYEGGAAPGPVHELSGGLRTPLSTDRDLAARALDDDGVAMVGIWLDPDLDPTNAEAAELVTCAVACPDELTAQFELPEALSEGRHTMLVRSEDGEGNATRDRWRFHVADLGEADRSRLGLEQWFQYDSTDVGGDSNLHVNADTGNVVWHSVPVVDPGRGLSTVVNLTYNSQDQSGLLGSALGRLPIYGRGPTALDADRLPGLSYAPAGNGFSIAVSGPTRVNEPLRGVILAAAAEEGTPLEGVTVPPSAAGLEVAMTDADGTEHVFTNVAGRWVAPPGLNMHLRRYKPGGSIVSPIPDKWALTRPDGVTHFFDNLGFLTRTEDRNGNTLTYVYERVNAFDGAACAAGDVIGRLVAGPPPRLCTRRLTSVVDPAGRSLTIEYESGGFLPMPLDGLLPALPLDHAGPIGNSSRIARITDHADREYRFEYDDDGFLTRFTEAANRPDRRVTGFDYEAPTAGLAGVGDHRFLDSVLDLRDLDEDGQIDAHEVHERTDVFYEDRPVLALESIREPRRPYQITKRSDGPKEFDWQDDPDRLEVTEELEWRTQREATTTHEVDDRGRPVRVTDALGTVTALTWSDDNKVTRHVRAQGTADESATDYAYDTANGTGVLESQTAYPGWPATTGARTTDLVWAFGSGRHHSTAAGVTDATGTFVADLDRMENPKPGTGWDFTFDDRGNVTRRTDAAGNFAETGYDGSGRITREVDELGNDVTYSDFHPTGEPQTVVDERDNEWTYRYDPVANVTAVVDPRGEDRTGAEGNPFTTTLGYDSFDRMTREHMPRLSDPDDTPEEGESRFITRTRAFDRNGNVTSSVDGRGRETEISYMEMDQPLQVTEPGSAGGPEITQYVYDTGDRLIGTIAPKGHGLTTRDDVEETHADECAGTDPPLAFLTRFCLDAIGRMQAEVRYSTRTGDPSSLITSFAYDRRDNLIGMVDANRNAGRTLGEAVDAAANPADQRMAYAYDKVDEQTTSTEKPTEAGAQPTVWRSFYDANGNQVETRHPRGDAIRTTRTYDHRDQLIASRDPLGHLTCIERRADGRVAAETTPRGTAAAPERCTDGDPSTRYTHYTRRYEYDPAGNLRSRSVPFAPNQYGRTDAELASWKVTYTRNSVGDPITIEDSRGHSFSNTFYDTGNLRSTDRPSFYTTESGTVQERTGRSANAEHSADPDKPKSTLGQTDFGRVDPEPLPDLLPQAGHTRLTYDGEMNLTKVHDTLGNDRLIAYDGAGRVTRREWPFKANTVIQEDFAYDKHGNLTSFIDGEREETTFAYDGYNRRAEQTTPGAKPTAATPDPLPEVTRLRYDLNGNLRFRETPRGVETPAAGDFTLETVYDSLDRVSAEVAADGGRTSYAHDVASNVISETGPRGQGRTGEDLESFQTRMAYDDADRLIESRQQVTDGTVLDELVTSMEYDADDNLTKLTEPGARFSPQGNITARVTDMVSDARGMPWKRSEGAGEARRTSIIEFDANGNLRRMVHPRGVDEDDDARTVDDGSNSDANLNQATENATLRIYDEHDLVTSQRLPWNSGDTRRFRLVFQRSADGLRRVANVLSAHQVDLDGEAIDDRVPRTSYTYFATDWVSSVSDQKLVRPGETSRVESRLINYDYDRRGAQIEWRSKNAGETSAGRHITRAMWPNGELRSRTAKKVVESEDATTTRRYQYFYNRNRSLVGMNDVRDPTDPDDDRLTSISVDPMERQLVVDETFPNGRDTVFAYDIAGNVVTRKTDGVYDNGSFTGEDAKTTTFEYDSLDREFRMEVDPATGANRVTTTNYWPSGRKESRRKPNGTVERWFRTTRDEISRFERQPDGAANPDPDDTIEYTYDPNGNRTHDQRGDHRFNARNQLVRWTRPSGRITTYELNGEGSATRVEVRDSETGPVVDETTFAYKGERLRWAQSNLARAVYRHDDFGNVVRITQQSRVSGGQFPDADDTDLESEHCRELDPAESSTVTAYCYDEFERLTFAKGQSVEEHEIFDYDGLDRRDGRTVEQGQSSVRRDLSYIGMSELLSRERDADGKKRSYDYDSEGDRQGQQVTSTTEDRYRAYTKDANGSVVGLEDDDGEIQPENRYRYDPYGDLDQSPSSLGPEAQDNPFRFEGFYYDSGVKSYDMFARHYRPDSGRFLSQDRYASAVDDFLLQADALTQNRYVFAGGNPVSSVEWDGHCAPAGQNGGPCLAQGNSEAARKHNKRAFEVAKDIDEAAEPGWRRYYKSKDYTSGRGIMPTPQGRSPFGPVEAPSVEPIGLIGGVALNRATGLQFQQEVLNRLGLPENHTSIGRTRPDALTMRNVYEAKHENYLYRSRQIRRQERLARRLGGRLTIVARPDTKLSRGLERRAARSNSRVRIVRYHGNGIFSAWNDKKGARPLVYNYGADEFQDKPKPPPDDGDDGDGGEPCPELMATIGPACGDYPFFPWGAPEGSEERSPNRGRAPVRPPTRAPVPIPWIP